MSLQLREGAWYKTRGGEVVGPSTRAQLTGALWWKVGAFHYPDSGRFISNNLDDELDLIEEVPCPGANLVTPAVEPPKFSTRTTRIVFGPAGCGVLDDQATTIEIVDEGAGEYVNVSQLKETPAGKGVAINMEEWPALRDAIESMVNQCRKGKA